MEIMYIKKIYTYTHYIDKNLDIENNSLCNVYILISGNSLFYTCINIYSTYTCIYIAQHTYIENNFLLLRCGKCRILFFE